MIIECTSCGARAKLPDSKEGAKVRCSECSHVYVARPPGARRGAKGRKEDPTKYYIGGGVVVVILIILAIVNKDTPPPPPPKVEEAPPEEPHVPTTGWDSQHVVFARQMHDLAFSKNTSRLFVLVDFEKAHTARRAAAQAPEASDSTESAATPDDSDESALVKSTPEGLLAADWFALNSADQTQFKNEIVDELVSDAGELPVASWKPYDGDVVEETDSHAIVRLHLQARSGEAELADRWIEWEVVLAGDQRWKAVRWERWISPEEEAKQRRKYKSKVERRTLSDGSEVIEGVVRTEIDYHSETPAALIQEIEGLIDQVIDPDAGPRQISPARKRLEDIGKHAVPGLLKRMGSIPLDDETNAIQLNLLHRMLTDITQYQTTFVVHVAMGGTQERMDSGIKQWFGWYDRKWKRYWKTADEVEEEDDPFWDDSNYKPKNENERRRLEERRAKRDGGR